MKHELRVMQARPQAASSTSSSTFGHGGAAYASIYAASKHRSRLEPSRPALEAGGISGSLVNAVGAGCDRDRDAQSLHR